MLFVLPREVKRRFDKYSGNGQSALLQEVRETVAERYPRTTIRGDGQVVLIKFLSCPIELVPVFANSDSSFEYPDTNDGGSWKTTNPLPEQQCSLAMASKTNDAYIHLCNMLRIWRNHQGLAFSGLLVDSLVYDYLENNMLKVPTSYSEYPEVLTTLFDLLSQEDKDKCYWNALGSHQHVFDKGKGAFISKARRAFEMLTSDDCDVEEALSSVFGHLFSSQVVDGSQDRRINDWRARFDNYEQTEEFVEERFLVDIQGSVAIDCTVTQKGFRPNSLREMLRTHKPLRKDKQLCFKIDGTTISCPFQVYWKVRNCGEEAYRRHCVRGQIVRDKGKHEQKEQTDFEGEHYVECYLVKDGVCVARDRIDVPITSL